MYRLLVDEGVEHEVHDRLGNYGHEVEHVEFVPTLGKGSTDVEIAAYSKETDRSIVTYDSDFYETFTAADHAGVLYFEDEKMAAREVADIVHTASKHYPQDEISGVQRLGREWL